MGRESKESTGKTSQGSAKKKSKAVIATKPLLQATLVAYPWLAVEKGVTGGRRARERLQIQAGTAMAVPCRSGQGYTRPQLTSK